MHPTQRCCGVAAATALPLPAHCRWPAHLTTAGPHPRSQFLECWPFHGGRLKLFVHGTCLLKVGACGPVCPPGPRVVFEGSSLSLPFPSRCPGVSRWLLVISVLTVSHRQQPYIDFSTSLHNGAGPNPCTGLLPLPLRVLLLPLILGKHFTYSCISCHSPLPYPAWPCFPLYFLNFLTIYF